MENYRTTRVENAENTSLDREIRRDFVVGTMTFNFLEEEEEFIQLFDLLKNQNGQICSNGHN